MVMYVILSDVLTIADAIPLQKKKYRRWTVTHWHSCVPHMSEWNYWKEYWKEYNLSSGRGGFTTGIKLPMGKSQAVTTLYWLKTHVCLSGRSCDGILYVGFQNLYLENRIYKNEIQPKTCWCFIQPPAGMVYDAHFSLGQASIHVFFSLALLMITLLVYIGISNR